MIWLLLYLACKLCPLFRQMFLLFYHVPHTGFQTQQHVSFEGGLYACIRPLPTTKYKPTCQLVSDRYQWKDTDEKLKVKSCWAWKSECVFVCVLTHMCHDTHVTVKGQFVGVSWPFLSCGFWDRNEHISSDRHLYTLSQPCYYTITHTDMRTFKVMILISIVKVNEKNSPCVFHGIITGDNLKST